MNALRVTPGEQLTGGLAGDWVKGAVPLQPNTRGIVMSARKIDFGALRERLSFGDVLAHYNVSGKQKGGGQWQGFCPLPSHVHKGDGEKPHSPSFSVNLGRSIYNCFGCGGKGNVLEFVIRMEGFDPENGEQFRAGALRAEDLFFGTTTVGRDAGQVSTSMPPAAPIRETVVKDEPELPVVVNATLDFALQGLDAGHPYLADRGFTSETAHHFGLGFTARGLMKNRIAIPIKNRDGQLVGYAGRVVDDNTISDDNPRYRLPGDRERGGTKFVFRKSELLYHPDELRGCRSKYLFLVEGFASVWWFWQHRIRPVAAVMGSSLSERQAELVLGLTSDDARIVLIPDADAAGQRLAQSALPLLAPHRFIRWLVLWGEKQPTDMTREELDAALTLARER